MRSTLRCLEDLARIELQQLKAQYRIHDALDAQGDPVWLGLAWDMGMTGRDVDDAAPADASFKPVTAAAMSTAELAIGLENA